MNRPQSIIDLLLAKLNKEGKVEYLDEQAVYEQTLEINKQMEEYETEKQQKAAASADELAKVVLTN